jgi:glycosyltransferase involved in cell wall biosynthesis
VIGNTQNKYGRKMLKKYGANPQIIFAGGIYDQAVLHSLKHHASLYLHGHSVGGTNPSLLEAMASEVIIAAHDNVFNKEVLSDNAYYFSTATAVKKLMETESLFNGDWVTANKK